jgi:hypothetical protein
MKAFFIESRGSVDPACRERAPHLIAGHKIDNVGAEKTKQLGALAEVVGRLF